MLGHNGEIRGLAFMSESELISGGYLDQTIIVWNKDANGVFFIKAKITCEKEIMILKKIDSKRFLSGHNIGAVCLWEQSDSKESKYILKRQIGENKHGITAIE